MNMKQEELTSLTEEILAYCENDKTISKHLSRSTWLTPNENYQIFPMTADRDGIKIELANGRKVTEYTMRGAIKRVKAKYAKYIHNGFVGTYDGSCPRVLYFTWKEKFSNDFRNTDLAQIIHHVKGEMSY